MIFLKQKVTSSFCWGPIEWVPGIQRMERSLNWGSWESWEAIPEEEDLDPDSEKWDQFHRGSKNEDQGEKCAKMLGESSEDASDMIHLMV